MTIKPENVVSRAFFKAATRPGGLCVSGAAMAGALAFQSGALAGAGVAAFCLSTTAALVHGRFWRTVVDGLRREAPVLPFADDFVDPSARSLVSRLSLARVARREVCGRLAVSGTVRERNEELAADLEENALELLRVLDRVASYLSPDERSGLRDRINRLAVAVEGAPEALQVEYDRARRALEGRLGALEELDMRRQLLRARLEAIVCALEAVAGHIAHSPLCEAADRALADELAYGRVVDTLALAKPDIDAEETLRTEVEPLAALLASRAA